MALILSGLMALILSGLMARLIMRLRIGPPHLIQGLLLCLKLSQGLLAVVSLGLQRSDEHTLEPVQRWSRLGLGSGSGIGVDCLDAGSG